MRHFPGKVAAVVLVLFSALVSAAGAADADDFTVVLLPDTQHYSARYPETYLAQTEWIKRQAQAENIRFVIHLGDIVHRVREESQWQVADRAYRVLDGVVPCSVLPGNHDLDIQDGHYTHQATFFNQYFPPSRFDKQPWYGGHYGSDNQNNFCTFEAAGMRFLVLSLEFFPRDEVLQWADQIVEEHPQHRVVVATHNYLWPGARDASLEQGTSAANFPGNGGNAIWEKFVRKHANIFLVVCGHISALEHQTSINDAGRPVHELLADYQNLPHGGDGWLVRLRFQPQANQIHVDSYSPVVQQADSAPLPGFTLEYPMTAAALAPALQP